MGGERLWFFQDSALLTLVFPASPASPELSYIDEGYTSVLTGRMRILCSLPVFSYVLVEYPISS